MTNPVNVALECGLYDLPDDPIGESPRAETALGDFDAAAIAAIRALDAAGEPPGVGSPQRAALANFLALQISRTPEERERGLFPKRVHTYAAGRAITRELVAEYLERIHLGFRPREQEASAAYELVTYMLRDPNALSDEFFVRWMFASVPIVAPRLLEMTWTLEIGRKQLLVTSDMPLVIWRRPTARDQFEGLGVSSAEELRFPLDPAKQLVLSKRKRTSVAHISAEQARNCNKDMAAACHEVVIANPRHEAALRTLPLARRRPVLRFNTGPMYVRQPDGTMRKEGEVLHTWVPRR